MDLHRLIDGAARTVRAAPVDLHGAALRPAQPPIVQLHRLPVPGAPPTGAVRLDAPPSTRLLPHAGATQANPVSVPALRLDLPRQVPQPPPRPRGPSTAD